MAKLPTAKWLMRKIKNIDRERLNKHLDILVEETGKSRLAIEWAIFWSFITRGTSYTDFFRCNFINLTKEEKDTFFSAKQFYRFVNGIDDNSYEVIFHDKLVFNELFRDYLHRDFLNVRKASVEEIEAFLAGREYVFAKETTGEGGHGISKVTVAEITDVAAWREELLERKQYLLEEAIVQAADVDEINPNVVCSFRIVTLVKDGVPHIVGNALRVNQDDAQVIGCTNDLYFSLGEDGRIDSNVIDDYGTIYDVHPLTGKRFDEVQLAHVDEAFEMVKRAALEYPQIPYVGWDVGFTKEGPLLIEGNEYPGYGLLQFYKLKYSRTGHLKTVRDILGEDEFNRIMG